MQEILFYRELDFPLKSIAEILASPNYDKQKAFAEQKRLLTLKKERLTRLIAVPEQAEKGDITMRHLTTANTRLPGGKRKKYNVYAETREQCEIELAEMIEQVKAEIAEEKAKLKEGDS